MDKVIENITQKRSYFGTCLLNLVVCSSIIRDDMPSNKRVEMSISGNGSLSNLEGESVTMRGSSLENRENNRVYSVAYREVPQRGVATLLVDYLYLDLVYYVEFVQLC